MDEEERQRKLALPVVLSRKGHIGMIQRRHGGMRLMDAVAPGSGKLLMYFASLYTNKRARWSGTCLFFHECRNESWFEHRSRRPPRKISLMHPQATSKRIAIVLLEADISSSHQGSGLYVSGHFTSTAVTASLPSNPADGNLQRSTHVPGCSLFPPRKKAPSRRA